MARAIARGKRHLRAMQSGSAFETFMIWFTLLFGVAIITALCIHRMFKDSVKFTGFREALETGNDKALEKHLARRKGLACEELLSDREYEPRFVLPLHLAKTGKAVQLLLAAGANVDDRDANGKPPLWHALMHASDEAVHALLDARPDVTRTPTLVETAVYWRPSDACIISRLIGRGAHVSQEAYRRAILRGRPEVVQVFESSGVDFHCSLLNALLHFGNVVNPLCSRLKLLDVALKELTIPDDETGKSHAVEAIKEACPIALKRLLEMGVKKDGLLIEAVQKEQIECVAVLLAAGADPDEVSECTPCAAARGNSTMQAMLYGARKG